MNGLIEHPYIIITFRQLMLLNIQLRLFDLFDVKSISTVHLINSIIKIYLNLRLIAKSCQNLIEIRAKT